MIYRNRYLCVDCIELIENWVELRDMCSSGTELKFKGKERSSRGAEIKIFDFRKRTVNMNHTFVLFFSSTSLDVAYIM